MLADNLGQNSLRLVRIIMKKQNIVELYPIYD